MVTKLKLEFKVTFTCIRMKLNDRRDYMKNVLFYIKKELLKSIQLSQHYFYTIDKQTHTLVYIHTRTIEFKKLFLKIFYEVCCFILTNFLNNFNEYHRF